MIPKIVKYKKEYYVFYNTNDNGRAKLIDRHGYKFSGCPEISKLIISDIIVETVMFNKYQYFKTKIGVFSSATGNRIQSSDILDLFKESV